MKIVINPKYELLGAFIKSVPDIFEKEGKLIYKARNQLKIYQTEDFEVIVKSFKRPHLINRIVYGFFRFSKARRSYEHALELLKRGVPTPEPIAYVEEKKAGLLNRSYYVCVFEKEFSVIREEMLGLRGDKSFLKALATFIADIQNKGVLFFDMSPGNILSKTENGKVSFTLVDINRIKFLSHISLNNRYKNFERIAEKREIIDELAGEYAKIMSLNIEDTIREIHKHIANYSRNYHKMNLAEVYKNL